jgi:hypothetical protein
MKKYAANYLVSGTGSFLKNGIVVATETGEIAEFIDTRGELIELAQLIFLNGILIPDFRFVRVQTDVAVHAITSLPESLVFRSVAGQKEVSLPEVIETGKQVQAAFPELTIPQIVQEISGLLLSENKFSKLLSPGLYLLNGVNLPDLKFTPHSKLKKIL